MSESGISAAGFSAAGPAGCDAAPVDQAALGIADFEYPAFELQNILRILLAARRVLAQLPPGAFHGIDDRIFAHLQLRILAQKRHILLVAFEPRDAGFD